MGWKVNFAAIWLSVLVPVHTSARERSIPPSALEFQQRGARLRAELERTYQNLRQTGEFKSAGNDVSSIVRKFIPVGVSLANAERVLRSAGFELEPLSSREPISNEPPLTNSVASDSPKAALLATLILARRGISKMTVEVTLFSKTEDADQYAVKVAKIYYRGR